MTFIIHNHSKNILVTFIHTDDLEKNSEYPLKTLVSQMRTSNVKRLTPINVKRLTPINVQWLTQINVQWLTPINAQWLTPINVQN